MYKIKVGDYKCIYVNTEKKTKHFSEVCFLGDVHYGSKQCDYEYFKKTVNLLKEKNCYIVLMGDLIENATKNSVGAGWNEQVIGPQKQKTDLIEILKPIKDQIIGSVKGNHEERTYKATGSDPMHDIMAVLGISDRYFGWEFYGIISGGKTAYKIYAVHSTMGNKTGGLGLNASYRDIAQTIRVDIIARGHNHKNDISYFNYREIDGINNHVSTGEGCLLLTGHFLKRAGSYAAAKPYGGSPSGSRIMRLMHNHHKEKQMEDYRI
jgi:predicted phosphodiesterase